MVPFSALHDGSRYLVNSLPSGTCRALAIHCSASCSIDAASGAAGRPDFRAGWDDLIDNGNDSALPLPRLAKQLPAALPRLPGFSAKSMPLLQHMKVHVYTGQGCARSCFAHCSTLVPYIASHGLFLKDPPGTVNVAFSRSAFHVVPQAIQSCLPW